jgi:uncharacterized protein (TIGR02246 family)
MVRTHLKAILAVCVLISISAVASWAKAKSNAADEAAIKQLVGNWSAGFNNKDAHACAMLFTENGEFTSVRGDSDHGRPDVEKHYQKVFSTFLKNAHRTDTVRSVQFLSPKIASVDTEFEMVGANAPNSTDTTARPPRKGLLTWIVTKQDGRWYISIFHELDYFKECNCPSK